MHGKITSVVMQYLPKLLRDFLIFNSWQRPCDLSCENFVTERLNTVEAEPVVRQHLEQLRISATARQNISNRIPSGKA